ncbi:hypothetical protein [Flavobacterium psychrophilum]|uniref:Uncharacterized protein n=1 Tax=Flavobacterium psychrophilum TaxID=96345 RepID=A0A7U2NEM7_FLAPS|nr:hypothetical protein [Flavobacterium psychrophilum]QRE03553.1 hypothetical protein H0H26_11785 [Flavobacterium psychrophilum]
MSLSKTQIGKSKTSDFETWTFSNKLLFKPSKGDFAIVPITLFQEFLHSVQGMRNSMNIHPDCEPNSEFHDMVSRIDEITKKVEL